MSATIQQSIVHRPWLLMRQRVPPGATLGLSFMTPGTLDPRITFTRGSTATYFDATGTMQTVSGNTPRWDYNPATLALRGLLIEEARTNILLNTATLGTQSVAVTAQAYVLTFYGTGTITLSGVSTAGPLVGTGAFPTRVALSFTPTAGTLTLTVTGTVQSAQLEAGAFSTSYIPTTAAAVTRQADQMIVLLAGAPWFSASTGTMLQEWSGTNTAAAGTSQGFSDGTFNNSLYMTGSGGTATISGSGVSATGAGVNYNGTVNKTAVAYGNSVLSVGTNGVSASTALAAGPYPWTLRMVMGSAPWSPGANSIDGYVRRVQYWPRVLSNAELQSVTR